MGQFKQFLEWITKDRSIGNSPLTRSLSFFGIIAILFVVVLQYRGIDVFQHLQIAYSYYFTSPLQQAEKPVTAEINPAMATAEPTIAADDPETETRLIHQQQSSGITRVALHTLDYSQYSQSHSDGDQKAELVSSLLMIELAQSDHFELLDRSLVSALFAEKSLFVANNEQGTEPDALKKLPLSEFTLVGSLFSSAQGDSYSLKLVKNSTAQVIGASRFNFSKDSIQQSIEKSTDLVHQWLASTQSTDTSLAAIAQRKVAFGHFIDISDNDSQLNQGRDISERLIQKFVTENNYSVLSRTQMFPLLFEEYLRMLQYSDEYQESRRPNTDYLIHGKYRVNNSNSEHSLSIYLYLDLMKHGRELVVLHAANWEQAFQLINQAIVDFLPKFNREISAENIAESERLFIEAIRVRGLSSIKSLLSGRRSFFEHDVTIFSTPSNLSKPETIAPARLLVEKSYQENPDNQFAKLALAKIMESEGKIDSATKMIREVLRSKTEVASEIAFRWLDRERMDSRSNIGASTFESLVEAGQTENINQLLHQNKYLLGGNYPQFNERKYSDQLFFRSETLNLGNLDPDLSIQVFEQLRAFYYRPGIQVKYAKPRRFHPRKAVNKKSWHQLTYQDRHNIEAVIHSDIARAASNIHILDATRLPSVEYYKDVLSESKIRRRSNLEIAVDGFSSSGFLDTSYIRSQILLGYSLCQEELGLCAAGNMINSWVVDNTKPKDAQGRGGMFFNVTPDIDEKDRLIFLAADAVDRVHEANTTEMFTHSLFQDEYFIKKYQAKLQALLNSRDQYNSKEHSKRVVYAYRDLIRAHCIQLTKYPRALSRSRDYVPAMESLATLALKSDDLATLRQSLLADLALQYPTVFPYLIANTHPVTPFIAQEQDEMIRRVASEKIVPLKMSTFMGLALGLFDARVDSNNIETAENYIPYFIDIYGITEDTAMDFAYLYHRIGDSLRADKLLAAFGKNSFHIDNFDLSQVNGDYAHSGFDKKGRLVFSNKHNPEVYIIYNAAKTDYGLGEKTIKWRLHSNAGSFHSGNRNSKHPEKFAFGNGGRLTGDMQWAAEISTPPTIKSTTGNKAIDTTIAVASLQSSQLERPENNIERLFSEGYQFDFEQKTASKGFSKRATVGPLRDSYFSDWFAKTRKISATKEQLFEKGYLSVKGMPLFDDKRKLRDQIKIDFPDYSYSEKTSLIEALSAAKNVNGAGYVEIYHRSGGSWGLTSTLNPEDAIPGRKFGISSAITDKQALICSVKDGLYSFKRIDLQWLQQNRMDVRCRKVVMTNDWAAVSSREKVTVYRNELGSWHKTQTLVPDNYLLRKDQRHNFEYFGKSLAILKDTLIIGNPFGGDKRIGEVYIFSLANNEWRQAEILAPNTSNSQFGASISATEDLLVVGDPSSGDYNTPIWQSGSVHVYTKKQSSWKLTSLLVAEDRTKTRHFGKQVLLKADEKPAVLIRSTKELFRYDLSL